MQSSADDSDDFKPLKQMTIANPNHVGWVTMIKNPD